MQNISIILLLLLSTLAFKAQAQKVLGPIEPNGSMDKYPTHLDSLGKGGFRSVPFMSDVNLIPVNRRKEGMLVYVANPSTPTDVGFYQLKGGIADGNWDKIPLGEPGIGVSFTGSLPAAPLTPTRNQAYYNTSDKKSYIYDGVQWQIFAQDGVDVTGSVTMDVSTASTNTNLSGIILGGTQTPLKDVLTALIYPGAPASATLTLNGQTSIGYELGQTPTNPSSYTLKWTATKAATTKEFKTITIKEYQGNTLISTVNPTFTIPVTLPLSENIAVNPTVNTSYTLSVTTVDGKTTNANAAITFSPRRYWGSCVSAAGPTDAEIKNSLGTGGSEVSPLRARSFNINPGQNYVFYAYAQSLTALSLGITASSGLISVANSPTSFNRTVANITNDFSKAQLYYVYTSPETYSATTAIVIN